MRLLRRAWWCDLYSVLCGDNIEQHGVLEYTGYNKYAWRWCAIIGAINANIQLCLQILENLHITSSVVDLSHLARLPAMPN